MVGAQLGNSYSSATYYRLSYMYAFLKQFVILLVCDAPSRGNKPTTVDTIIGNNRTVYYNNNNILL